MSAQHPVNEAEKDAQKWAWERDLTPTGIVELILQLKDTLAVQNAESHTAHRKFRELSEKADLTAVRLAALKQRLEDEL